MIPKPVANIIIIVVTAVWAANNLAQLAIHSYHPDVTVNAVFMSVVGGALALGKKTANGKTNGNGNGGVG